MIKLKFRVENINMTKSFSSLKTLRQFCRRNNLEEFEMYDFNNNRLMMFCGRLYEVEEFKKLISQAVRVQELQELFEGLGC